MVPLKRQELTHAYGAHPGAQMGPHSPSPVPAPAGPAQAPGDPAKLSALVRWLASLCAPGSACACRAHTVLPVVLPGHKDLHVAGSPGACVREELPEPRRVCHMRDSPYGTRSSNWNSWVTKQVESHADGHPIFCHSRTCLGRRPPCLSCLRCTGLRTTFLRTTGRQRPRPPACELRPCLQEAGK